MSKVSSGSLRLSASAFQTVSWCLGSTTNVMLYLCQVCHGV